MSGIVFTNLLELILLQPYKKRSANGHPCKPIDPNMAYAYGKYSSQKGSKGDMVDFLLHYDEQKAKEDGNGLLGGVMPDEDFLSSALPPKVYQKLQDEKLKSLGSSDEFGVFDTQVQAYKLQLMEAFKKRYEKSEKDETVKAAKIAEVDKIAASLQIPSRLV